MTTGAVARRHLHESFEGDRPVRAHVREQEGEDATKESERRPKGGQVARGLAWPGVERREGCSVQRDRTQCVRLEAYTTVEHESSALVRGYLRDVPRPSVMEGSFG